MACLVAAAGMFDARGGGMVFAGRPADTAIGADRVSGDDAGPIRFQEDLVFGKVRSVPLRMDLAAPVNGAGPFPAVVCIHGGAWCSGSKREYRGMVETLARRGYVAVSVDYRLAPDHRFPAQLEDVKCAVRYLRAHAKALSVAPDRIGVLGDSAGGHLALLAGLTSPADGMEGDGGWLDQSSKVQAVVNYFGPADFTQWRIVPFFEPFIKRTLGKDSREILQDFLGTGDGRSPLLRKASPVFYIDAGDPPVLTFHGTLDLLVPIRQSHILHAALRAAGVPEKLVPVVGAAHGWSGARKAETDGQAISFFDQWLKTVRKEK